MLANNFLEKKAKGLDPLIHMFTTTWRFWVDECGKLTQGRSYGRPGSPQIFTIVFNIRVNLVVIFVMATQIFWRNKHKRKERA